MCSVFVDREGHWKKYPYHPWITGAESELTGDLTERTNVALQNLKSIVHKLRGKHIKYSEIDSRPKLTKDIFTDRDRLGQIFSHISQSSQQRARNKQVRYGVLFLVGSLLGFYLSTFQSVRQK